MALVLDTAELPPAEREGAVHHVVSSTSAPTTVSHNCPPEQVVNRMDLWDMGDCAILRSKSVGQQLSRTPRQVRASAPEMVSFAINISGTATAAQGDIARLEIPGTLMIRDITQPYQWGWQNAGEIVAFLLSNDQLGLSVDAVRRAMPLVEYSPLKTLVWKHMMHVTSVIDDMQPGPALTLLGSATVDLFRALIASVQEGRASDGLLKDTLLSQIKVYIRQHLSDQNLSAKQIAQAHNISVRQLYKIWAFAEQQALSEWILARRLEGARQSLTEDKNELRTIAATAHRWGFADGSHFARRFRAAYGISPREWRDQGSSVRRSGQLLGRGMTDEMKFRGRI